MEKEQFIKPSKKEKENAIWWGTWIVDLKLYKMDDIKDTLPFEKPSLKGLHCDDTIGSYQYLHRMVVFKMPSLKSFFIYI